LRRSYPSLSAQEYILSNFEPVQSWIPTELTGTKGVEVGVILRGEIMIYG
jgi:hypothetical protein